jgi:hypothetical protein
MLVLHGELVNNPLTYDFFLVFLKYSSFTMEVIHSQCFGAMLFFVRPDHQIIQLN